MGGCTQLLSERFVFFIGFFVLPTDFIIQCSVHSERAELAIGLSVLERSTMLEPAFFKLRFEEVDVFFESLSAFAQGFEMGLGARFTSVFFTP